MSRHESDREDLLQDASALSPRWEFSLPGFEEPVTVGFRKNGNLSCYFGPDPVYQFDAAGRLRRAYAENLLYRSEGITLSRIERHRDSSQTSLLRHDLTPQELHDWCADAWELLRRFTVHIDQQDYKLLRSRGDAPGDLERLRRSLQKIISTPPGLSPPLR